MARTTLDLDPSVLQELRRQSARDGKSMGVLASELLGGALADPRARAASPAPFHWTSRDLGLPHVDLEDKEALRALLDEPS